MSNKKGQYSIEQEVQCGDILCAPPIACYTSNNIYYIKHGDQNIGLIREEANCCCRCLCMPAARSAVNTITFNNLEYTAVKEFRCTSLAPCAWFCCCRPDITVLKGGKIIGTIEQPCYPGFVCKLEVNCYRGESRDESSRLWSLKKCMCNCHTLFGKNCGCCSDCAKYMDVEISPGAAGQNAIHGKL